MEVVLEKKTFSDLKFVRITGEPDIVDMLFRQIPRELFEQVKDVEFNISLLYQMPSKFIGGANNMFYVLVDDEDLIKGILWCYLNILTEAIQIQVLSIEKEYQFGDALEETEKFIRSWMSENESLKVQIMTTRPHVYQRNGWTKSKQVLMET
jgi:hypothetical protein